jgi:hypothetical protein
VHTVENAEALRARKEATVDESRDLPPFRRTWFSVADLTPRASHRIACEGRWSLARAVAWPCRPQTELVMMGNMNGRAR